MRNLYKVVQNKYSILENNLRFSSQQSLRSENERNCPSAVYIKTAKSDIATQRIVDPNTGINGSTPLIESAIPNISIQSLHPSNNDDTSVLSNVEEVSIESIRDVENLLNEHVLIEKIDGDVVTECEEIVSSKLSVVVEANSNIFDEHLCFKPENTLIRKRKRFSRSKINQ